MDSTRASMQMEAHIHAGLLAPNDESHGPRIKIRGMTVILARGYDASSSPLSFLGIVFIKHILLVMNVDLKDEKGASRACFSRCQRSFQ